MHGGDIILSLLLLPKALYVLIGLVFVVCFFVIFSKICKIEDHLRIISKCLTTDIRKSTFDLTKSTLNKNGEIHSTNNELNKK